MRLVRTDDVVTVTPTTDAEFARVVYDHLHPVEGYSSRRDWQHKRRKAVAEHFEVAESTVERWSRGSAVPHPLLQAQVVAWIEEHS